MDSQTPIPNPTPLTENIPPQNPSIETPPSQVYTAPHLENPPPPKKPFMFSKILLPIVIIFVLSAATAGTYLALNSKPKPAPIVSKIAPTSAPTSTPDPTANWKTYKNTENGFSLQYPQGKLVEISEKNTGKNSCTEQKGVVDIKIYPGDYKKSETETHFFGDLWVNISIVDNVEKLSPEDYVRKACATFFSQDKITSMKSLQIANNNFLAIIYKNVMDQQQEVIVPKGNKLYFIHGFSSKLPNPLFDQILSTFRFDSP